MGRELGVIKEPPADFYNEIITKQPGLGLVKGISLLSLEKSVGSIEDFFTPMNPLPAGGLVKMPKSQQLILILCNPFRNPSYKAAPLLCSAGLFLTLLDGRIQGFGLFSIQLSKRHQSPDPNSWARDCFPKLEQIDTFTTKIRHGLDGLFQLNEEME